MTVFEAHPSTVVTVLGGLPRKNGKIQVEEPTHLDSLLIGETRRDAVLDRRLNHGADQISHRLRHALREGQPNVTRFQLVLFLLCFRLVDDVVEPDCIQSFLVNQFLVFGQLKQSSYVEHIVVKALRLGITLFELC